jgi:hypothetical protein
MSDHPNRDLSAGRIAARVVFSLAVTAFVSIGAYSVITWLAALHP